MLNKVMKKNLYKLILPFFLLFLSSCDKEEVEFNFSNEQNAIGYKWKIYDFDAQIYSVNSQMTYIIKSVSNRYFKLRFLDFYNNEGEKGFPSFEIQEL